MSEERWLESNTRDFKRGTAPEIKPLHVRVAEALGFTTTLWVQGGWRLMREDGWPTGEVPRYDTDWSAAGPLIEKYNVCTAFHAHRRPQDSWEACAYFTATDTEIGVRGETALFAVCNLILALKEAGKL